MTELTKPQLELASEIRRLCLRTHGKEHVMGWEIVLFRACFNKAVLPSVDYMEMANLLRLFIASGGWIMQIDNQDTFFPRDKWASVLKDTGTQ